MFDHCVSFLGDSNLFQGGIIIAGAILGASLVRIANRPSRGRDGEASHGARGILMALS